MVQILPLTVTNGTAVASFPIQDQLIVVTNGTYPDHYAISGVFAYSRIDIALPGFQLPRDLNGTSGNAPQSSTDPSFTRWLALSFSPQINTQPFRTQAGALPAPWGNVNCYYFIRFNTEPTTPNYDLPGQSLLYIPNGSSYQALPGPFLPAYAITDANGDRLLFNAGLSGYTDVFSTLSYNASTGVYTLSNAGPPGAMKQKGRYTYTFSGSNLTTLSDDLGNQQTCAWSSNDPFLTVTDSSSGRSLVFHRPSSTAYVSSLDARGPSGAINTHTVLTYDATGHLTANKVYDASGITLFHQDTFAYGGANGDAIISATKGVAQASYTYVTDNYLLDPFGLGNNRVASATFGSSSDTSSSDNGLAIAGTVNFAWGPTTQGYNHWGVDSHTNKVTDARGNVFSSIFSLSGTVSGSLTGMTNKGPDFTGATANSNTTKIVYTPDMVKPTSVTVYASLYNSGLVTAPWQAFFDTFGNLIRTQDPLAHLWQFGYNANGTELLSMTDPTNLVWNFHYGENGAPASRLTSVLDPAGVTRVNNTYNAFGQLLTTTVPAAISASGSTEQTALSYDAATGDLLTVTDPLGDLLKINSYDALGDPLSVSLFPDTGNPATSLTPLTAGLVLNAAQQPVSVNYANGAQVTSTYSNGILTQLKTYAPAAVGGSLLEQTTWNYDSRSRLYKASDLLGTAVQYRYDKNSNRTQIWDGLGHITKRTFGSNNEPTGTIWPDGRATSLRYDAAGRPVSATDERGLVVNFVWDAANRLTDLQFPATPAQNIHTTYDDAGRPLTVADSTGSRTYSYDAILKRLQSVTTVITALPAGQNTFTVSYVYYGDGSLASMTSPAGQTTYHYDASGQLVSLTNPLNETTVWTHDHVGRPTSRTTTSGSGTQFATTYIYGGSNQPGDPATAPNYLSSVTQKINGTAQWSYTLQHAYTGQLLSLQGTGSGTGQNRSAVFGYDSRGRLTSQQQTYNADAQYAYTRSGSYSYDLADNLMGGAGGWTYNSSNQVTSAPAQGGLSGATGLSYDLSGNLTALNGLTLSYDALGQRTQASNTPFGTVNFTFNADGQRVSKSANGQTSYFLYDGDSLLAELDGNGNTLHAYTWGEEGLISDTSSGASRFYGFDPLGNLGSLWNAGGQALWQGDYDAWGENLTGVEPDTPFGWQGESGGYRDREITAMVDIGYVHLPGLGRSATPSGVFGRGGSPNRYAAPGNDPVNYSPADYTADDDWVFADGTVPTQRQMYAPFLSGVHTFSQHGQGGLLFAASFNPLYLLGEGLGGRDLYNCQV